MSLDAPVPCALFYSVYTCMYLLQSIRAFTP